MIAEFDERYPLGPLPGRLGDEAEPTNPGWASVLDFVPGELLDFRERIRWWDQDTDDAHEPRFADRVMTYEDDQRLEVLLAGTGASAPRERRPAASRHIAPLVEPTDLVSGRRSTDDRSFEAVEAGRTRDGRRRFGRTATRVLARVAAVALLPGLAAVAITNKGSRSGSRTDATVPTSTVPITTTTSIEEALTAPLALAGGGPPPTSFEEFAAPEADRLIAELAVLAPRVGRTVPTVEPALTDLARRYLAEPADVGLVPAGGATQDTTFVVNPSEAVANLGAAGYDAGMVDAVAMVFRRGATYHLPIRSLSFGSAAQGQPWELGAACRADAESLTCVLVAAVRKDALDPRQTYLPPP